MDLDQSNSYTETSPELIEISAAHQSPVVWIQAIFVMGLLPDT